MIMDRASTQPDKAYKGLPMEGMIARWYARSTARDMSAFEAEADRIAARLPRSADVLEVAPGPGYLAVALAKRGDFRIVGLDVSRSFVAIAAENARRAGVAIDFRLGDAAAMPMVSNAFDFLVCRAAFKNFADPVGALCEMYRVLRPGGEALVIDMRKDASDEAIDEAVAEMRVGRLDAFFIRAVFKLSLRKRAYSRAQFAEMTGATPFGAAEIGEAPLGFEARLRKPRAAGTIAAA
jgi:ubiquinone/menaquinone biosynthesis C-methylase UbiE